MGSYKIPYDSISEEDRELIRQIARDSFPRAGSVSSRVAAEMDLMAVHSGCCPLRLQEMADAGMSVDVLHDVYGIACHLNRGTGQLGGNFLPRFAVGDVCFFCGTPAREWGETLVAGECPSSPDRIHAPASSSPASAAA